VAENTKNAVADRGDEVRLGSIENLSAFAPVLFFLSNGPPFVMWNMVNWFFQISNRRKENDKQRQ